MSISLTPEQISNLARQINEAISGLTNIEAILEATRADLERARNLEQRANTAKSVVMLSFLSGFLHLYLFPEFRMQHYNGKNQSTRYNICVHG